MRQPDELGNAILGIGGGCLLLVLLCSLAFMWGTGKVAKTCCDFAEETENRTLEPVRTLSTHLKDGNTSAAYALMSDRYRALHSEAEFVAQMDKTPILPGAEVHFLGRTGSRHLLAQGYTVQLRNEGKRAIYTFAIANGAIDRIQDGQDATHFDEEEINVTLDQMFLRLREGNAEDVHASASHKLRMNIDREAFDALAKAEADVFTGPPLKIATREWVGDNEALIQATATGEIEDPPTVVVRLLLFNRAWRLAELRVERPALDILDLPPAEPAPPAPPAPKPKGKRAKAKKPKKHSPQKGKP